jgi:DHA1 family multidrug resistance protein-like MFS transporter
MTDAGVSRDAGPDRAAIWSLVAVDSLARISYQLCRTPVLPLYVASLGASPAVVGATGAASTVTGIVLKAPAGAMSDAVGKRPLLLFGLFVFAAGPFLYLPAGPDWLVPIRLFHGLATAVYSPVAMAAVAELAGGRRGEYMAWLSNSNTAAALLGSLLGGWLLASGGLGLAAAFHVAAGGEGTTPSAERFQAAWWTAGALGVAAFLLGLAVMKRVRAPERGERRGAFTTLVAGMKEVGSDRRVLLVSCCEGVQNLTVGMIEQFLPLYAVFVAGCTPLQAGLMFGVQTLTTILSKPLFGRYSDVRGREGLVVAGMFACALPFAAIPWFSSFPALLALALLFGLGEALVTAASSALVSDLCRRGSLGAAMGVFGTIGDAGHAAGPILGGLVVAAHVGAGRAAETIREAAPFRTAFGAVGAALVVFALAFLASDRRRRRVGGG